MGSPGPTKSRHNKREQRRPAEKLAAGDPGEGTRSGQAAGGAPARPVAWPPPRPPAGRATRPGLPAGSRRPPGRVAQSTAALCFRQASGSPSPGSPDTARVPSPGRSPSRPLPGSLSNFLGRGRWDRGVGSVSPAGLRGVNRATDEARGDSKDAGRKFGAGVRGGAAGRSGGAPAPRPALPVPRGRSGWGGQRGPKRQPPVPNPPRRLRAAAQTLQRVKFPVARGAGDTRPARGRRPGAWCGRTLSGRWVLEGGGRGRRAEPWVSAAACVSGLTFVRARAASAARPPTRVFCNQSVRLIKGGATAS